MTKQYYFNKEFLKLLKLEDNKSYSIDEIYEIVKMNNLLKKNVIKRGNYGVKKYYYFTPTFKKNLNKIVKFKYKIRSKFKITYAKNILWSFIEKQNTINGEFPVRLDINDFEFIKSIKI